MLRFLQVFLTAKLLFHQVFIHMAAKRAFVECKSTIESSEGDFKKSNRTLNKMNWN